MELHPELDKFVREATPLIASGNAATRAAADAAKSTLIDLGNAAKQRPSGLTPLEVAASVAVLSMRRLRRRTTLFGTNKVVHKTMGGWGSFLFLSNLITGACDARAAGMRGSVRYLRRGDARYWPRGAAQPACRAAPALQREPVCRAASLRGAAAARAGAGARLIRRQFQRRAQPLRSTRRCAHARAPPHR